MYGVKVRTCSIPPLKYLELVYKASGKLTGKLNSEEVEQIKTADKERPANDELRNVKFSGLAEELDCMRKNPDFYASGFAQYFRFEGPRNEVLKKIDMAF